MTYKILINRMWDKVLYLSTHDLFSKPKQKYAILNGYKIKGT